MVVLDEKTVTGVKPFLEGIRQITAGSAMAITFRPKKLADELIQWHRKKYAWHHNDTVRSYTQMTLRKRGNRGKRTDFAYYNRAMVYFGYDQFDAHRRQPNKLVCFWDPSNEGDYVGEHNPCLVLVRYKEQNGKLNMTVVFRKRDVLKRMIGNWVMLCMWLNNEATIRKMKVGTITDFSMDTITEDV